jgi:hypothetical protein
MLNPPKFGLGQLTPLSMKYQANCPLQLVMVVLLAVFVHLDNGFYPASARPEQITPILRTVDLHFTTRLSPASPATAGSPWTSGELAPRSRPSPLLLRLADVVSVPDPSGHAMTTMPSSAYEHPRLLCTSTAHERVRISSHHSSISSTRARLLFWVAITGLILHCFLPRVSFSVFRRAPRRLLSLFLTSPEQPTKASMLSASKITAIHHLTHAVSSTTTPLRCRVPLIRAQIEPAGRALLSLVHDRTPPTTLCCARSPAAPASAVRSSRSSATPSTPDYPGPTGLLPPSFFCSAMPIQ